MVCLLESSVDLTVEVGVLLGGGVLTNELMLLLGCSLVEVTEAPTLMAPITIATAAQAATMTRLASNVVVIDGLRIPLLILCILSHTLLYYSA
jgi:hypothetical protein